MKNFSVNIAGRVNNFNLPEHRPLVPLYEAIVNAFHAIEEKNINCTIQGNVKVEIIRRENELFDDAIPMITGFVISDNGIGFNEINMNAFLESDSTHKAKIGGKGVGRFSWLKAFKEVVIESVYEDNDSFYERKFKFDKNSNSIEDTVSQVNECTETGSRIYLKDYFDKYSTNVDQNANKIAIRIVQHCLVYFLRGNCPNVEIIDGDTVISLNNIFSKIAQNEFVEQFEIKNKSFKLLHVKINDKTFNGNKLYLCANNRLVHSEKLDNKLVDLGNKFYELNKFWYVGVITSSYLDDNVDMNRLSFSIPRTGDNLFNIPTLDEILNTSCIYIERYLDEYLKPIREEKLNRISLYATKTAPQYKHLLKYKRDEISKIKPGLNDDNLDDALYNIKRKYDKDLKKKTNSLSEKIMSDQSNYYEYNNELQSVIEQISDSNKANLAEYVAHRRVIIDLFEKGLRRNDDGKFNKEEYMHKLIYPMRKTFEDIDYNTHNLWIVDEKLSYCSYISSDVPFNNNNKDLRTDIMFLDNPVALIEGQYDGSVYNTVIIFELKKPMRDDYSSANNPVEQLWDYVYKIKSGKAKDKNHRDIKVSDNTKFYLYAVCDITDSLKPIIAKYGMTRTPDELGYYYYNNSFNAYLEILSYDKIVIDAKKRNRVLFDKLGI